MSAPDELIVANPAKWVHKELSEASDGSIPVNYDHGLFKPTVTGSFPAFWTATAHAARLKRQFHVPFLAPGPYFLEDTIPQSLLGRDVLTWTLRAANDHLLDIDKKHWIKLAEMKDDRLPAQYGYIRDFVLLARDLGAPDGTYLQISSQNLCFVEETRFFVLDGEPITGSRYNRLGDVYDADRPAEWSIPGEWEWDFAKYVTKFIGNRQPKAYTLDIGQVMYDAGNAPDGFVVLEANPVWSSGIYGSDPALALKAILGGFDYTGELGYHWIPDPWLIKKAEMKGDLR